MRVPHHNILALLVAVGLGSGCSSDIAGPNRAPRANAGPDMVREVGQAADLDGSASFDPDGDRLNYQWDIISAPAGATAEIINAQSRLASITPDQQGLYAIRLVVSDTRLPSEPDIMHLVAKPHGCVNDNDCIDQFGCTDDSCDSATHLCNHVANDALCPDDGVYCNGPEICDVDNGCVGSGDPCPAQGLVCDEDGKQCRACVQDNDCDDGVDCTTDSCDAGTCLFTPDDTRCPDDGVYCNGPEMCDTLSGCVGSGDPCALSGGSCDEVNDQCAACGDGYVSVGAGEDCDPVAPAGDNCCDPTSCTWTTGGQADPQAVCSGAPECKKDVCDGSGGCSVVDETDGVACSDDGVFCNGAEECQGGSCTSPGNPCTDPSDCDETNDVCAGCGDGVVSSGEQCDSGNPQNDHCCDASTCQWITSGNADPQSVCSGAPECQLDVCDGSGGCTFANVAGGTPCTDDGVYCNGPEQCDGLGACVGTGDPCPGTECNTCQEATGTCFDPNGTACTDDGNVCTDDQCDGSGACAHPANSASCDDGQYCNGADSCSGGTCSQHAGDPCQGGFECDNVCDEAAGNCHVAAGTACTDDGNVCTDDQCDGSGVCVHPANSAPCDDGQYCNGVDTCSGGVCNHAGDPCQGGPECDNVCDETAGNCHTAAGTACADDGLFCTGTESCDGSGGCVSSGDPCPGICDESTNSCGSCGDGVVQVGSGEECDPGAPQNDNCCDLATCTWVSAGGVDPQGICSGAPECQLDVCDGAGGCSLSNAAPGTACTDDGNVCTDDQCDGSGACAHPANSAPCDDGLYCNGVDTCSGGVCNHAGDPCQGGPECNNLCNEAAGNCHVAAGTACTDEGNVCTDDQCDGSGACAHPANSAACDDGQYCNGADSCSGGTCSQHAGDPCQGGPECDNLCNEVANNCLNPDGTPCTGDAFGCTDDTCQAGACQSVENNANCTAPDLCVTACSPDASGCVTPPGSFALTCEDPVYLDLDTVSDCSITLAGGGDITGQEACLNCTASVGVTTLIETDFEDDLNPGNCAPLVDNIADGWTIVPGTRCYGNGTTCPMSNPDNRDCCDNLNCPIDFAGNIAFQADRDSCTAGDRQWRLQHTFDTTGLQNLELCFDYADRQAGGNNDVLQVDVADPNGNYQAAVFCDADGPRAGLDDVWFHTCVDLSTAAPFADDNQALSVIFFAHSNDNNNRIYIDNITLRGESISCPAGRITLTEDFTGCTDPLSDWNGWTVGGGAAINCSSRFNCYDGSNRAWVNNTGGGVGEFFQYFDLSAVTDVELCFYYGENGANNGEIITVDVDSGSGWTTVWSNEGNFGQNNTCGQLCLNLSDLDPAVDHNANAGIRFQLEANDKEIDLDQITISGHPDCAAPAVVSLTNPQDPDTNGSYDFTATDTDSQLSAEISCQWTPDPALSDWDRVWYRPAGINPTNVPPELLCANPNSLNIGAPATIDTDTGTISGVAPGDIRFWVIPQGGGAPALGVFAFDNIDIAADVGVTGSNALVLLACNDVNISGVIDACASGQAGGAGGDDGGPGGSDGNGMGYGSAGNSNGFSDSGGGGAGFGGAGGAGGDSPGAGGGPGGTTYGSAALSPLYGGSGGGGANDGGGGGGGGAVQISAGGIVAISSPGGIDSCGAGGAAPSFDGGAGGGGGSGGAILVEAMDVTGDGTLAANGGGGGAGDDWTNDGNVTASPGEDGPFGHARALGGSTNGTGNGGDGGNGGGADTATGDPGEGDNNSGGGGGAAGIVRVNTLSGTSTFSATGTASPDASSGAYSEGTVVVW